jgi:hypothetical protein
MKARLLAVLLGVWALVQAGGAAPAGRSVSAIPERWPIDFRISEGPSRTTGSFKPDVATSRGGTVFVVWNDGVGKGILGKVVCERSGFAGAAARLHEIEEAVVTDPRVACRPSGHRALVTWTRETCTEDGDPDIMGRVVGGDGQPMGSALQVNVLGSANLADVAAMPQGGYVVAWTQRTERSDDNARICVRRVGGRGKPRGEALAASDGVPRAFAPQVAVNHNGQCLVVFFGYASQRDPSYARKVYARLVSRRGMPVGRCLRVDEGGWGVNPCVAAGADGRFLVCWDGDGGGTFGRIIGRDGEACGPAFKINTEGRTQTPAAARDGNGNYVVTWSQITDPQRSIIMAALLDAEGRRIGGPFRVDSALEGWGQFQPTVGAYRVGDTAYYFLAWLDSRIEGDGDIFGAALRRRAAG